MSGEIVVVAVGEIQASVPAHLCAALTEVFKLPCRVGAVLPVPEHAFNTRRSQYSAQAILQQLLPHQAERVLGVVDLDLYVPELNFVFGLADQRGKRAVIALPRLRQRFYGARDDEALFLARAVKEAVHELGHTYGLDHCRDRRCVMTFSNSLADTDYKGQEFCPKCRKRLLP
ncbi:MAG TPA: archaemetzincin family Zn-dependent metalloprotease [Syntrophales bacterium]|nr:archaemetzincin family Zn-dependent metalloprotease [Syntrophales bacterium]